MAEIQEAIVQLIDEYGWERAEVLPIGQPIAVTEWLRRVAQLDMTLGVLPARHITAGSYRGGWVVSADNARGRLYFVMTAEAFEQCNRGIGRGA